MIVDLTTNQSITIFKEFLGFINIIIQIHRSTINFNLFGKSLIYYSFDEPMLSLLFYYFANLLIYFIGVNVFQIIFNKNVNI